MRHALILGLVLGAVLVVAGTASAGHYGYGGRSLHPRSTFGYYRSYPRNYAEFNYGGYRRVVPSYGYRVPAYGYGRVVRPGIGYHHGYRHSYGYPKVRVRVGVGY